MEGGIRVKKFLYESSDVIRKQARFQGLPGVDEKKPAFGKETIFLEKQLHAFTITWDCNYYNNNCNYYM